MKFKVQSKMLFAVFLAFATIVAISGAREVHEPKTYKMDITHDHKTNWGPLIRDKAEALRFAIQTIIKDYSRVAKPAIKSILDASKAVTDFPEFSEEIKAIAALASIRYEELFIANFLYELSTFCTSIVAQDEQGNIIHGRNLDYFYQPIIANLTAHVDFYKNGEYLFRAEVIVGSVGILTGYKPGAFGISINERHRGSFTSIVQYILRGKNWPVGYWLRHVLTNADSYDEALEMLSEQKLAAPVYYILSGVKAGEGAIITRSPLKVEFVRKLSESKSWYIIQTNSDDDVTSERKEKGAKHLDELGQNNLTLDTMLEKILSVSPTMNGATIYSTAYSSGLNSSNYRQWY
eukprot:TRINITY_DN3000_c0_g3_i1.p1 TRINITY_DN3000_c0_g3~~TRINITY_DN3000_c0_g3_i1.p1  ORF type:complete len:349 (-),score=51.42 TRINITY_DN3000_c0_g3_i1:90-1136(-)